jgi:hypothetical protein
MANPFWRATAEAVVAAVDAVYVTNGTADVERVADFAQLTSTNAEAALALAMDLGFLTSTGSDYSPLSPLCRAFASPNQRRKAAALRIVLEAYVPFTLFRDRLIATEDATAAAKQIKILLKLDVHHDDIKDTLLSLGQYSQALVAEGGGVYRAKEAAADDPLEALAVGCAEDTAAERRIRLQLGAQAADQVSRDDVIVPLSNALQRASAKDGRGAVLAAGNAVDSYLTEFGQRANVNLAGKHGINAKAEALQQGTVLPKKLLNVSKYLGHVRNAADHGIDDDINAAWDIREHTGVEDVFVACSFIAAATERELSGPFVL